MKTNIHTNPVSDFTSVNVQERKDLRVSAGDTVKVWVKIKETSKGKEKTRLQAFEGIVLSAKHGNEAGATFTVRKVSNGVGVERIFPLFSPMVDKIEIMKRAKVRRAKLYHIREKVAREIKRQMRRASFVNLSTLSDTEEQERIVKEAAEAETKAAEDAAAAEAKAQEEAAKAVEVESSEVEKENNTEEGPQESGNEEGQEEKKEA